MAHLMSTKSGHCYDLDDVQSGLRYIAEQQLGPVPSHVLALVYNAIEHIQRQEIENDQLRAEAERLRALLREVAKLERWEVVGTDLLDRIDSELSTHLAEIVRLRADNERLVEEILAIKKYAENKDRKSVEGHCSTIFYMAEDALSLTAKTPTPDSGG